MTLIVPADPATQSTAKPRPLEILWKERMDFNGTTPRFEVALAAIMHQARQTPAGATTLEDQRLHLRLAAGGLRAASGFRPDGPAHPAADQSRFVPRECFS